MIKPRPITPLGIVVQQLEEVMEMAKQDQVSPSLMTALEKVQALAAGIDPYIEACSTPESTALANLAQKTASEDWSKRFSDGETVRQLEQDRSYALTN